MPTRTLNRLLGVGLLLAAAACGLPLPRLVFDTPTPPPPPPPTTTPAPGGFVTFRVRLPASTPAGAIVAAQVLDPLGGGQTIVPLANAGDNLWTGTTSATLGSVLRYRYVRTTSPAAGEVTPTGQAVPYRLLHVAAPNTAASDIVAAWSDQAFSGDQGAIVGAVRNSNTGRGVLGLLVSAAGQVTLTAWDGSYALYNVPSGEQRVTVMAPDGSLQATQGTVAVPVSQVAGLDLAAPDPNAVHITFVVRPPAGTDPAATLRLVGTVSQLGDTFVANAANSSVLASRAPTLAPLGDGRFAVIVRLHQGTVLRYAYTLGDGVWNSELDSGGAKRQREYLVPFTDAIVEEAIAGWHTGPAAPVTFEVTTPSATPANDLVTIQFRLNDWLPPLPMWRAGLNTWRYQLANPENFAGAVYYRYCRNYACGAADDASTAEAAALSRAFTPTVLPQTLKDTVIAWRWQAPVTPPALNLPPPAPRGGFVAGLDLPEAWQPNARPLYGETVRAAQAAGANMLTIFRRSALRNASPPIFADDLALSMPPEDVRALAEQARAAGLRTTLHPVTCAYTPYGICDYWSGAPFSADFWNAWFAAYERHLLTQADVAAQAGVDVLVVADFKLRPAFPGEPEAPPEAEARWRDLLARVRLRFPGQLAFELLMGQNVWPNTPAFLDSVDVIRLFWWASLAANNAPTVNDLVTNAGGLLDTQVFPVQQRLGKPFVLSLAYYSADGAATQCLPRPDGACHLFSDFNPEAADVVRYGLDLAEQADLYQAMFTAAHARPWISGVTAFGYNPVVALQDKSVSVRGKPAETLLNAWFRHFMGR